MKIFGDNLDALQAKAFEVERVIEQIPGAIGVAPSRVQGKPYLEIAVNREVMGRYGLRAADRAALRRGRARRCHRRHHAARAANAGRLQVRLERADREDIDKLGELLVPTPAGPHIPLGQVADIKRVVGPNEIQSENGRLRVFVQANVTGRDLGGFVDEIKERIDREVKLDPGMTIEYSGQYENQLRARRHAANWLCPLVLLIIFVLLAMTFHSVAEAAHVILAVPFALTGGVLLQAVLGYNFSVAVWVGYIALFGTAIQTGVVMVVYLEEAVAKAVAAKGRAGPGGRAASNTEDGTSTSDGPTKDPHSHRTHRRRQGRRAAPPASEGDDGRHRRGVLAADLLGQSHRHGNHAAARRPGDRRHAVQSAAHPDRHARHLRVAAGTEVAPRQLTDKLSHARRPP